MNANHYPRRQIGRIRTNSTHAYLQLHTQVISSFMKSIVLYEYFSKFA